MGAIAGQTQEFYLARNFAIEVDDITRARFTTCSALERTANVEEHYEGGAEIPVKILGRTSFGNITLTRGSIIGDSDFYEWAQDAVDVEKVSADVGNDSGVGLGVGTKGFKKDLTLVLMGSEKTRLREWTIKQAFPIRFSTGDFDANSDGVLIEELELAFDSFALKKERTA